MTLPHKKLTAEEIERLKELYNVEEPTINYNRVEMEILCSICGGIITNRTGRSKVASCYECKTKRKRAYSIEMYRLLKK